MGPGRKKPYLLGLTGSVGMGKTTTAQMFAARGVPVWDADAAVARAYAPGGAAIGPLAALFPQAVGAAGVDRDVLRRIITADPDALARIEKVVHPIVAEDRAAFIGRADAPILLFDIPLLFETGADAWMDAVAVVSTRPDEQRRRVMARPGMTPERLAVLLARQLPDADKRARADFLIDTSDMDSAAKDVDDVLTAIRRKPADA